MKSSADLLLYAGSENSADLFYATGFFAPDAFVYFRRRGRSYLIARDLELDRARANARVDRVLSHSALQKQFPKAKSLAPLLALTLQHFGIRKVRVPADFPLHLAQQLRRHHVKVWTDETPLFPERTVKTAEEIRHLSRALRITEAGLAAGIAALRRTRIGRDGYLYRGATKLTSEALTATIQIAITRLGGSAPHGLIVAGGNQACDCHERGYGPLRAHQAIVLDIFPRDNVSRYWGDMTRTVVRGRASDAIRAMYAAVARGQKIAMEKIRDGRDGKEVHQAVQEFFKAEGYKTGRQNGRMAGFFHGTGHGLGLDIHDPINMGSKPETLRSGNVLTVEPGLYYHGIGGVRLEDVVLVTKTANRLLSHFPNQLEI